MALLLVTLCLFEFLLHRDIQSTVTASEFQLKGDFLIGGFFDIHDDEAPGYFERPVAIECSSKTFYVSNYRRFQLMRFSIEEINNSTSLLPDVSLGYNIFDHCSDIQSFPDIFNIISGKDPIYPWTDPYHNSTKVIAVVSSMNSPKTRTVAPLFMTHLIPMVSDGAASSIFSIKRMFPSFLRTIRPNKDVVEVIVEMLLHFNWRWVALLNIDDDYGNDGRSVFMKQIQGKDICLAYTKELNTNTNYASVFEQIQIHNIHVIIVFAPEWMAEDLIKSAIQMNVTNKTWIAGYAWSLNKKLPKMKGIRNIGTVLGVAEPVLTIPGFDDFIYSSRYKIHNEQKQAEFCNQFCNCSNLSPDNVTSAEVSFNFQLYAAVYAIAHALHNALQCGGNKCNRNITVYPHMVLTELKKSNFTLLNQTIQFDSSGDPRFGYFNIIFWNSTGEQEIVGFHKYKPSSPFFINDSKIQWHGNGTVPSSLCSPECEPGFRKSLKGIHRCCFECVICPTNTYVNSSVDPYTCFDCKETEWSTEGSTFCDLRSVEYIPFTDPTAVVIMVGALALVGLTLMTSVLFAVNYHTPVVRSAGGPMCFLILGCLCLCSISVFFFFDRPTVHSCVLRYLPFLLFYTVCLACFIVRSFQNVFIFTIAFNYPSLKRLWKNYHGRWFIILGIFISQGLLLLIAYSSELPLPIKTTDWNPNKIILGCHINGRVYSASFALFILLYILCFIFSYMGKDLPKNYNEAKAITFCLLLLILTWIIFATVDILYKGKHLQTVNSLAVLSSLYGFLLFYFFPKSYIIIFQPQNNTQEYFHSLLLKYNQINNQ